MKSLTRLAILTIGITFTGTALVGCNETAAEPEPAATTQPSASASEAPSVTTEAKPAKIVCLDGTYRIAQFTALNSGGGKLTGRDGDFTLDFDEDGTYSLEGDGDEPITVNFGSADGDLIFDGEVTGKYTVESADSVKFGVGKAEGTMSLREKGAAKSDPIPIEQMVKYLAPQGDATVTCSADNTRVQLKTESLTFGMVKAD